METSIIGEIDKHLVIMVYTDDSPDVLTVSFTKGKNVRKNTENSTLLFSHREDQDKTHTLHKESHPIP
jgi:hypothetical protein